jgi:hypothetical protein
MKVKIWCKGNSFGIQLDNEMPQVLSRDELKHKLKRALFMDSAACVSIMLAAEIFGSYEFDLFETYENAS